MAGVLTLAFLLSATVATTSILVSSSADALLSGPGPAPNVFIISGGGRVPETGSVDLNSLRNATAVLGVSGSSPEVYAPVAIDGRIAVVRGVNLTDFSLVQGVSLGSAPLGNGSVLVGEEMARTTGLEAGSVITMQGVLANFSATVRVSAVVAPGQPYDGEIISSLQLAQALRGFSGSQATFLRLKVDPAAFNETRLLQAIRGNQGPASYASGNPVIQQLQLAPTASLLSILPAGQGGSSIATVLSRGFGAVQTLFLSLDVVVILVSTLAMYFATAYWLESARPTSETLSALGLAKRKDLAWHLAAAVPAASVAGLLGFAASYFGVQYLAAVGGLSFFFQPIQVPLDPAALVLSCGGPAAAAAASIIVGKRLG